MSDMTDDMPDFDEEDRRPRERNVTKNKDKIVRAAKRHGWTLREEQPNIGLLIFDKVCSVFEGDTTNGHAQVNVYTTAMTVTTIVNHPRRGRGQMYRLNVPWHMLEAIFKNPRVHARAFKHPGGYFPKKVSASTSHFGARFLLEGL